MHCSVIFEIISILNYFFSVETGMSLERMYSSVIFEIISILNCFFSRNLNVPTKNVMFCHLCNHFNTELSFSIGC